MSKTRKTRSSKDTGSQDLQQTNVSKAQGLLKVFYIPEQLVQCNRAGDLTLERFYHPGKDRLAWFIICNVQKNIMEVFEFAEPRRSWFINNNVCSNGRIYVSAPVDVTFLMLHYLRSYCMDKALALDSINDKHGKLKLLIEFVRSDELLCVADVKTIKHDNNDMVFYKYNAEKTLAWLSVKTMKIASSLRSNGIHCGTNAQSQNFKRSEKTSDCTANDIDYQRMACNIVGNYLDRELHEELLHYLEIPSEIQAIIDNKKTSVKKRKSLDGLSANEKKKPKLDEDSSNSKNNSLLDGSLTDVDTSLNTSVIGDLIVPITIPAPIKERTITAKQKALAKGAKGTKSITSFFKK